MQRQLLAFLLILLAAWLAPAQIFRLTQRVGWRQRQPQNERARTLQRWRRALAKTYSPFLAIGLGLLVLQLFAANGWLMGLLRQLLSFFWVLLAYRLLVALLYVALREERARWFSERLLKPLFIFVLIVGGVRLLSGIVALNEIALLTFENNVITTGSLFVAAVVFYLFLAASWLARDALNSLVLPRLRSDPRHRQHHSHRHPVRARFAGRVDLAGDAGHRSLHAGDHRRGAVGGHWLWPAGAGGQLCQRHPAAL